MDEVKSIRIRKRLYTDEENSGTADIKITLYRKRQKRYVKGFSLNSSSDENFEVWKESRYDGDRYENLSDDAIIDDSDEFSFDAILDFLSSFFLDAANALGFYEDLIG